MRVADALRFRDDDERGMRAPPDALRDRVDRRVRGAASRRRRDTPGSSAPCGRSRATAGRPAGRSGSRACTERDDEAGRDGEEDDRDLQQQDLRRKCSACARIRWHRAIVGSDGAARRGHKGQNARNARNRVNARNSGQLRSVLTQTPRLRGCAAAGTSTHRRMQVTAKSIARWVSLAVACSSRSPWPRASRARRPRRTSRGRSPALIEQSKGESGIVVYGNPPSANFNALVRTVPLLLPVDQGHRVRPRRQHDLLQVRLRGGTGCAYRRHAHRERPEPLGVRRTQGLRPELRAAGSRQVPVVRQAVSGRLT